MFVVPLAEGAVVAPDGRLDKGFCTFFRDTRKYIAGVPMVFVEPKHCNARFLRREDMLFVQVPLSPTAELLRKDIKALVPKTGTVRNSDTGEIVAIINNDLLAKMHALANELKLVDVLKPFPTLFIIIDWLIVSIAK